MAVDVATLGLRVDASGAITTLNNFSGALDKTGQASQRLTSAGKAQDVELRKLAEMWAGLTDASRNHYTALVRTMGATERFTQIQRQLVAEEQKAIAVEQELAAAKAQATTSTNNFGVSLRSLRSPLSTLSAQMLSINPTVAQFSGLLGSLALGSGIMIGVLAGIAAVAAIYNKLTSASRAAREEVEALSKSLSAQRKAAVAATEEGAKAIIQQAKLAQTAAEESQRRNALERSGAAGGVLQAKALLFTSAADDAKKVKDAIDGVKQAEINLGQVQIDTAKARFASANESYELEKSLAADRKRWSDEEEAAARKIATAKTKAEKEYYEEVEKNRKFAQKQEEEWADKFKKILLDRAQQVIDLREERDKLLDIPKVDIGRIARDAADDIVKDMERSKKDAAKYAEDMRGIWRKGIGKIVTDGTKSFRDFFQDVLGLFSNLMARMDEMRRNGGKVNESLYKGLGVGSAAIGGAFAGYQIGQQTGGDIFGGGFGGATSGALSGLAIAGPLGAVAGGLTGLVGGLAGAANAAADAAKQLKEMQRATKELIEDFHNVATGTQGSLTNQIERAHRDADAARRAAAASHPTDQIVGSGIPKANSELEHIYQQIAADETAYIERLKEEARIKNGQFKEDLQVRLLRAQGREKEADKLALKQQQARELAALDEQIRLGLADEGTRALLLQVHAAELLKKTVDALTTSVKNAPQGFKVEGYVNRFAAPLRNSVPPPWESHNPWGTSVNPVSKPPVSTPFNPDKSGLRPTTVNNYFQIGERAFLIDGDETPAEIVKKVKLGLLQVASRTVGDGAPVEEAWPYVSIN